MVFEVKIIKQKLEFEECLKQRLEFICEFSKVTPTFINSSIRKIDLYSVENESRKNDIVYMTKNKHIGGALLWVIISQID